MKSSSLLLKACVLLTLTTTGTGFASRIHRGPTARPSHSKARKAPKLHGQREIESDRTREIQSALIREHYMSGEPTGQWDPTTESAMKKFQADQGWQSKLAPDSRALIKLGLGPGAQSASTPAYVSPAAQMQPSGSNGFVASSGATSQH